MRTVRRKIVRMMRHCQEKEGKEDGVVVLAEGLAEFLSDDVLKDVPRDDHGHISVANVDLGKMFATRIMAEFTKHTGLKRKVTGLQLGYPRKRRSGIELPIIAQNPASPTSSKSGFFLVPESS